MTATTDNSSTTIMPALCVVDGKVTTTSQQVAEHFGKEHKLVLRAIRNLLKELPKRYECNFAPIQIDVDLGMGRTRKDPAYRLTRDAFTLLAMGFTGKEALHWKLAYIDTFNKMEAELLEQMLASRPAIDYERISPAQKQALKELVNAQVHKTGKHHQTVWTEFQTHFRVNSYHELPAARFDEACQWLGGKRVAAQAVPPTQAPTVAPSYELPAVDFDFMRTMNDGLCDPKPINSAVRAVAQQISWKLAAEAQVGILQFLERFIAYRTNDAERQDVSCVAPMLEKLTLSHCLAYRFFEELDRARQMAGLMQQMANTCVNSIQQRMGTVFA